MFFRQRAEFLEIPSRFGVHIVFFVCFFQERGNGRHFLFASPKRKRLAKEKRPGKTFGCFPRTPSIDQSLALDLRRMEVGESTIDFVGADAERSCSRRRSVTDAACPLRVLIAPTDSIAVPVVNVGATIGRPLKAPLSGEPSRGSRGFDWEGRLTRGGLETIIKFPMWTRHSVVLRSRGTNGWNRNTYHL